MSNDVIHTPDATKEVSPETTNQNLKSIKFWCVIKGALSPASPVNSYSGGRVLKKQATSYMPNHMSVFLKPHFWAENDSKGSPEVIYQPGYLVECWEALAIERVKRIWV